MDGGIQVRTLGALTFKLPSTSLVSPSIDMRRLDLPWKRQLQQHTPKQFASRAYTRDRSDNHVQLAWRQIQSNIVQNPSLIVPPKSAPFKGHLNGGDLEAVVADINEVGF